MQIYFSFHGQYLYVLREGFHLSASVLTLQSVAHGNATVLTTPGDAAKGAYNVALVFDRRHITSCSCSCTSGAAWCAHVVALCLFRIHQVSFRWSAKYTVEIRTAVLEVAALSQCHV